MCTARMVFFLCSFPDPVFVCLISEKTNSIKVKYCGPDCVDRYLTLFSVDICDKGGCQTLATDTDILGNVNEQIFIVEYFLLTIKQAGAYL